MLAIEEEGKTGLFTVLALADSDAEVNDFWASYRRHTAKNRRLSFLKAFNLHKGVLAATEEALQNHAEAASIDSLKQLSTYTDCLREKEWHSPDLIPKEYQKQLASELIAICESSSFREITEEELAIYSKHLRPVKGALRDVVERALVACMAEIQGRGLFPGKGFDGAFLVKLIGGTR
jgi:AbiV family abortive infection protein